MAATLRTLVRLTSISMAMTLEPQYSYDYAQWSTALQAQLLQNYNTNVPATVSTRSENSVAVSYAGTDIKLQMRVFKVESVDAAHGKMAMKVWLRHNWKDERLAWNESAWGGINMIALSTDMPQQIWTPDLVPYNSLTPTSDTLAYTDANVYSDGSIFWSRPGIIEVMCKFSGLVMFPYDNLQCSLEIGGWKWSGSHQGIEPSASGAASFSNQEATAGASYTEYTIKEITSESVVYEYPCCPSEPWPVVFYTITLHRSSGYFFQMLLWPYVLLTTVSFLVFGMSHQVGERLGFGITLILAMEVSKTVFSHMIPVCGEILWLEIFSQLNLIFCIVSLAESCVVLFLAHYDEKYLLPKWLVQVLCGSAPCCAPPTKQRVAPTDLEKKSRSLKRMQSSLSKEVKLDKLTVSELLNADTSLAAQLASSLTFDTPKNVDWRGDKEVDATQRLSMFERYFWVLDSDSTGGIELATAYSWLTFTCVGKTADEIWAAILTVNKDFDDQLIPIEFLELCMALLWDVRLEVLATLHETHAAVLANRGQTHTLRWKRAAKKVDRAAMVWIPMLYFTLLFVLLSIDLSDAYARPPTNASKVDTTGVMASSMFNGLGTITISHPSRLAVMLLLPAAVLVALVISCCLVRIARARNVLKSPNKMRQLAEKKAVGGDDQSVVRISRRFGASSRDDDDPAGGDGDMEVEPF